MMCGAIIEPMSHSETGDFAKLGELIRRIQIALLTTVDATGHLHTRPVQTLDVEGHEALWFFTDVESPKADELRHDVRASLSYADPAHHMYVAVSGIGTISRDPEKARQLWTIEQRAYYPLGPEDPRLALLRVRIEHAEYWIAPGRLSYLLAAARAATTGVPVGLIGENSKLEGD
jgi:general stress protein 26